MKNKKEYQGGYYRIIEFIGLYIRFFVLKTIGINRNVTYLSGEEYFPKINKTQRFFCLLVGLISLLIFIFFLLFFVEILIKKYELR